MKEQSTIPPAVWSPAVERLIKAAVEAERAACAELANTSAPAFYVRRLILARGES